MATVSTATDRKVILRLELSQKEASQLMGLVQNNIATDEPVEVTELRQAIFHALKDHGVTP